MTATRAGAATARPRNSPAATCAAKPDNEEITIERWPPISAFVASGPPRNGTCLASPLAISLKKYSPAMCEPVPTPAVPKEISLPLNSAENSGSVFAGVAGLTANTSGVVATIATVRNCSTENPLLRYSVSLIGSAAVVTSSVAPSAAAPITAFAAMFPPAPGLFSMTTRRPVFSPRRLPTMRAMESAEPPGAKPTTRLICEFEAGCWAIAGRAPSRAAPAHNVRRAACDDMVFSRQRFASIGAGERVSKPNGEIWREGACGLLGRCAADGGAAHR